MAHFMKENGIKGGNMEKENLNQNRVKFMKVDINMVSQDLEKYS